MGISQADRRFMAQALGLARRGLGHVAPNPAVGCVIVTPDRNAPMVLGRGWTQAGGRPHAETEALGRAGAAARGAHVYVTLEPCAHHGETPPCAEALVKAGVARVVIAATDPDPRVSGQGIEILRRAGIETEVGLLEDEAVRLNEGFFKRVSEGRPMVTMKVATSLDGRIATASGESKWITGPEARAYGHLLRARHDAILTGLGTVISDDPELTCRLAGLEAASPLRVVVDSWLRLPEHSHLVQTARHRPTWVATLGPADPDKKHALERRGVDIIEVEADEDGHPAPLAVLQALAARGVTRVLLEAGAVVNTAFFKADLVDHIAWFRAPKLLGGDGLAVVDLLGVGPLDEAPAFLRENNFNLGADLLETYRRAH